MPYQSIPLAQVLQALPLDNGKTIMRALRRQVQVECVHGPAGAHSSYTYALIGRVGDRSIQTSPYPAIAPAMVDEFMTLLSPLIEIPVAAPRSAGSSSFCVPTIARP